eukprot:Phypoly_transcript_04561.p1 GENE.Phypoly_transcript_04561~~Phypoly_transcript_04561.p1  ORF type:complete len:341 (+),score=52.60 Phypoly_transcript_04561:145-1167(+)
MEKTHTCTETVGILDAGSQYSKVIDRRIRELNVSSELLPFDTPVDILKQKGFKAIIISGGPSSVYAATAPKYDIRLFESGIPTLGICYGMQLMNFIFGGQIEKKDNREDGQFFISVDPSSMLFDGMEKEQEVLLTHGDSVTVLAPGFKQIATSGTIVSGIENSEKKLYGLQFHPEVDLTRNGKRILANFLYKVCGLQGIYTLDNREHRAIAYIRQVVGNKKVLVLVSGGVDSSVCAALLAKALGVERIKALHIDNGFMRKGESQKVEKALGVLGLHLKVVDATDTFLNATTKIKNIVTKKLGETVHPEEKRKIIGILHPLISPALIFLPLSHPLPKHMYN